MSWSRGEERRYLIYGLWQWLARHNGRRTRVLHGSFIPPPLGLVFTPSDANPRHHRLPVRIRLTRDASSGEGLGARVASCDCEGQRWSRRQASNGGPEVTADGATARASAECDAMTASAEGFIGRLVVGLSSGRGLWAVVCGPVLHCFRDLCEAKL
jgi:hypothetical protein